MRKIVLLVSSLNGGGAERVATTLASSWVKQGAHVVVVPTFLGDRSLAYPMHEHVRIMWLSDRVTSGGFIGKLRGLRALVRELEPDVVVSFLTNVNVVALLALAGLRLPIVICERSDPAASVEFSLALRVARQVLYPFADRLVVQTSQAASRYRTLLIRAPQMVVIPNPLPASLHDSSVRALPVVPNGGQITTMGRLNPEKRFDLLIRAFHEAFGAEQTWTLSIWGRGPMRDSLQALIDELSLNGRVTLRGATAEPWTALAAAQIFVLTSEYEGFPNAMLEAMALGLPSVAFDCPSGPSDLASGGVAILVPSGDVAALAQSLRALADEPERRLNLGRAAAESVRSRFSETVVLGLWEGVFDHCRAGRASGPE